MFKRIFVAMTCGLVVGCAPPDPRELAEEAAVDVQLLANEAIATARRTQTFPWRNQLVSSLDKATGQADSSDPFPIPEPAEFEDFFRSLKTLGQRVFVENNIIDRPLGATVFQIRGYDVCLQSLGVTDYAECTKDIDAMQLSVRTSGDLDLTLLVGPTRHEVGTFRLRKGKSLSWESDFKQLDLAVAFIQGVRNDFLPETSFQGQGRVEWKIEKNGDADFSFSAHIGSDVNLSLVGRQGVSRAFSMERRSPALLMRIEGNNRKLMVNADVGRTTFAGLWSDLFAGELSQSTEVILSGMKFNLLAQGDAPIRLENMGLGQTQSSLSFRGQKVLTVDINENSGRQFSLEYAPNALGLPKFVIKNAASLKLGTYFRPVHDAGYTFERDYWNATYTFSVIPIQGASASIEWMNSSPKFFIAGGRLLMGDASRAQSYESGTCFKPFANERPNLLIDLFQPEDCHSQ